MRTVLFDFVLPNSTEPARCRFGSVSRTAPTPARLDAQTAEAPRRCAVIQHGPLPARRTESVKLNAASFLWITWTRANMPV